VNETVNEQDLIDMWQNILPSIGTLENWKLKNIEFKDIPIQLFNDRLPNYISEPIYDTQGVSVGSTSIGGIETGLSQARQVVVDTVDTEYIIGDSALIDYTMLDKIDNLQWLIFKVKKLSKSDYSAATTTEEQARGYGGGGGAPVSNTLKYHNWPYDYFSLIESAKIKIKYKN
jgi:hypothetical protein